MANITIPVIDLEVLNFITNPFDISISMTMPGPTGPMGPPAPLYYGTTDPDPDLGEDGAIYIKYVG